MYKTNWKIPKKLEFYIKCIIVIYIITKNFINFVLQNSLNYLKYLKLILSIFYVWKWKNSRK